MSRLPRTAPSGSLKTPIPAGSIASLRNNPGTLVGADLQVGPAQRERTLLRRSRIERRSGQHLTAVGQLDRSRVGDHSGSLRPEALDDHLEARLQRVSPPAV